MAGKKSGLGKGLDALFLENDVQDSAGVVSISISDIEPNRSQPRQDFDEESLAELADSIASHGVLQPLIVRPLPEGGYQLVAGERRWRASRMAGLFEVPVIIREMTDSEMMQIAMIENLQREDLNPVEEALGYRTLIDSYSLTHDDLSKSVGKSRSAISNALRLLALPDEILSMLRNGNISVGHAKALLSFNDPDTRLKIAREIKDGDLTVRDVEKLAKKYNEAASQQTKAESHQRKSFFDEVELALNEHLGRRVKVVNGKNGGGVLEIEFYNDDDLGELAKLFDTQG